MSEEDGYIKSLEPGSQAISVEGKSFENQVVFVNVVVTQIYSVALEKPYAPLSLPLGSESKIDIIF